MQNEAEIRKQLISNTIHLVAKGGFQEATTKALTKCNEASQSLKINEAYIYRLFGSKEGLYGAAFNTLDEALYDTFWQKAESLGDFQQNPKEKFYALFDAAWRFMLNNEENCRYYVRFYHSVYFQGEVLLRHRKAFAQMVSRFSPLFKEEADVFSVMHSVFMTMLNFAVRVYNGDLPDADYNRLHIFNVLYCMMMTYLKD